MYSALLNLAYSVHEQFLCDNFVQKFCDNSYLLMQMNKTGKLAIFVINKGFDMRKITLVEDS